MARQIGVAIPPNVLADEILFGKLQSGGNVEIDESDGKLTFSYEQSVPVPALSKN